MDENLYRRSGGMIGSLSQLMRGAAILAIEDGREQISGSCSTSSRSTTPPNAPNTRPASRKPRPSQQTRLMRPPRLPIPVPPARHETLASYLTRLAALHGLPPRVMGTGQQPTPRDDTTELLVDRIAAFTGHRPRAPRSGLARAATRRRTGPRGDTNPNPAAPLRRPPRRRPGERLLPHHYYVCTRHRYWIGPPDADQPATPWTRTSRIVRAHRHHLGCCGRHGAAVAFDAVLTGFLICGHIWADRLEDGSVFTASGPAAPRSSSRPAPRRHVQRLTDLRGRLPRSRHLAGLIASPAWRHLAAGDADQQRQFTTEVGRRLGRPHHPGDGGDAIAHWMKYDSWRPPSRPQKTFPDTRQHGRFTHQDQCTSRDRQKRSAPGLPAPAAGATPSCITATSGPSDPRMVTPMDGITATIWASQTTSSTWPP